MFVFHGNGTNLLDYDRDDLAFVWAAWFCLSLCKFVMLYIPPMRSFLGRVSLG
jgi:hypothetical protein